MRITLTCGFFDAVDLKRAKRNQILLFPIFSPLRLCPLLLVFFFHTQKMGKKPTLILCPFMWALQNSGREKEREEKGGRKKWREKDDKEGRVRDRMTKGKFR